jgi:5-formyltetrahydrofolate cyclo-ligase
MESTLLIVGLFIVIFGTKPLFEMFKRKREGEELIGNPWEEIHAIPGYKEARKVAAFYPLKGEPNILPVLQQLAEEGRLLLPRCTGPATMEFCHVQSLKKDLSQGRFGIMEPRGDIPAYDGDFTVFLVPGTKFNLTGERCGHGKGYYDRFLAKHPDARKAGIATPKQISVEPLTQKPTDIPMDQIIICRERP